MFKTIGVPNAAGFYPAFSYDPRKLPELWSTPEQREYNQDNRQNWCTCPVCKGWGYKMQRRGRQVIRENVGCPECLGLGKVAKEVEENAGIEGKVP